MHFQDQTIGRTAFITGADGFVGLNLTRELLEHGWTIYALSLPERFCSHLIQLGPIILRGDITDRASLLEVFPEDVDAVFHVAADTSLCSSKNAHQTNVNVIGTRNVVQVTLEKIARRFIHMSTVAVFGFHQDPIHENTPSTVQRTDINYFITPEIVKLCTHWLRVDATKARQELGYCRHSLEKMIQDACQWLSSENLLPE